MRSTLFMSVAALAFASAGFSQKLVHQRSGFSKSYNAVSASADVNGDGHPDIAVATYTPTQRIYRVLSGASRSGYAELFTTSRTAKSRYGDTIALGELTKDNRAELIVGHMDDDTMGKDAGAVYIYKGTWPRPYLGVLGKLYGERAGDLFGAGVAVIGDLTGDGVPELAVSASGYCDRKSYVKVYSGSDFKELKRLESPRGCTYFGASLAAAGDVNGDRVPDFMIGANEHSLGRPGFVYIVSGKDFTYREFQGLANRDHYGNGLVGLGDVDRDGWSDFAVGAAEHEKPNGRGYVQVISSRTGKQLYLLRGTAVGDYFGNFITTLRDINGDGLDELVVGAPARGKRSGYVDVYSARDGVRLARLAGPAETLGFGASMSPAGVVAGKSRLVISAGSSSTAANSGRVFLYEFEPARIREIGAGCKGSSGVPLLASADGKPPRAGEMFTLRLTRLPAFPVALLHIGGMERTWNGMRLPFDLSGIGMPGCFLHVPASVTEPMLGTGGTLQVRFRVPNQTGLEAQIQAVVDDGAANPMGLTMSNALHLRT